MKQSVRLLLQNVEDISLKVNGIEESMSVEAVKATMAALDEINNKMILMDVRIVSQCLQFGNTTLQSLEDTGPFVNDQVKSCLFGCFFDLIALMDAPRDTNIDEETFVKSLYNAEKVQFASILEVSTSASFLHITPICFCKAGKQDSGAIHGSVDKMLHLVKERHLWCHQGGLLGIKRDLQREITEKVHEI